MMNNGIHRIHGMVLLAIAALGTSLAAFAADPGITVSARQRYPWNGLVDLKFTIDGTSGTKYDTSFTAKDVADGTNLTMKTLYKSNGVAANVAKEQLSPGTYNWVWNATADLGEGTVLEKVVVEGEVSNPPLPVMSGLIAYYPFDGDVKDYSGNGFHLSGSAVSWIADQKGSSKKAASFAGGNDLKLNTAMNVKDTMTFVAWLEPTKNSDDENCWPNWQWPVGGGVHLGRINAGLGWCAWPMIIAPIDSKSIGISVGTKLINVFQNSGNFDCLLSYRSDFTGQWIHIAITIDNRAAPVLYVNGTKVSAGSTAFLESPLSISSTLGFGGASLWHAGMWYKGGVNDFAIYNRVLSATEVKSLYDTGK